MSVIYWDSMLFIFWLEDHPQYAKRIREIQSWMQKRDDQLCTSIFTLAEMLTLPFRRAHQEQTEQIYTFFKSPLIELLPFTEATAVRYARIRGEQRISPADAMHLASAAERGVALFLTQDRKLLRRKIVGIDFIASLDSDLF